MPVGARRRLAWRAGIGPAASTHPAAWRRRDAARGHCVRMVGAPCRARGLAADHARRGPSIRDALHRCCVKGVAHGGFVGRGRIGAAQMNRGRAAEAIRV